MRAIVTGSSGFVGRHLIPLLKAAAYEVIGIDPKNEDLNSRTCRFQYWLNSDFPEVLEPYDIFIHLAANIQSIDEREKGISLSTPTSRLIIALLISFVRILLGKL